jgi:sugar lactone lactonase YvrE
MRTSLAIALLLPAGAAALAGCGGGPARSTRATPQPSDSTSATVAELLLPDSGVRSRLRPCPPRARDSTAAAAAGLDTAARGKLVIGVRPDSFAPTESADDRWVSVNDQGDTLRAWHLLPVPAGPKKAPPPPPPPVPLDCPNARGNVVRVFAAATADSTSVPVRSLEGPRASLCGPRDLAFDGLGRLHVLSGHLITVYQTGAAGDAAPIRSIAVPATGFNVANGLGLDRDGNLYVATDEPGTVDLGSVTVYGPGAGAGAVPRRALIGEHTGLRRPHAIAVDAGGRVYTSNPEGDTVLVYARDANGNLAPARVLAGPATGLGGPYGLAFDSRGYLYVANFGRNTITVYAPSAAGDAAPVRVIEPPPAPPYHIFLRPTFLALDPYDTLYVATAADVFVYAPGAHGKAAPVRMIPAHEARGLAVGRDGHLYLANQSGTVSVYAPGVGDRAVPVRNIEGPATGLHGAYGVALDANDTLYVASTTEPGITVYAPGTGGDVPPVRTVNGPQSGLSASLGIAVDRRANLYVANGPRPKGRGAVRVYGSAANGYAAPIRLLTGAATGLDQPGDVAFDSRGDMYVVNTDWQGMGLVTVYGPEVHGNASPIRTITGPNTLLRRPIKLAVGPGDTLYVLNAFRWWKYGTDNVTVTVYAPGAAGDVEPVRSIIVNAGRRSAGGRLGLEWPGGIAVDERGTVYLANYRPGAAVAVYPPGAEGDVAPTRLIQGGKTRLAGPVAVALDGQGLLHVASVPEPAGFSRSSGLGIDLVRLVVRELGALDGRLTPAQWLRAHPRDLLRRYEFDPFLQDGAPWCVEAVSERSVPGGRVLTRRAVFYPSELRDSAARFLPPLPPQPDSALVRTECRLGLLLVAVSSTPAGSDLRPFGDSLQQVLRRALGAPETGHPVQRYWASARWWDAARWRDGDRTLVTANDAGGDWRQDVSEAGPRVLAFAHLPPSRLGLSLQESLMDEKAAYLAAARVDAATLAQALALAGAAPAAATRLRALDRQGRFYAWEGVPDSVRVDTLVIPPLRQWLAATAGLPRPRRAAALLAADRVLATTAGIVGSEDAARAITAATGARYLFLPIGGGYAYEGNLLREAHVTNPTGVAGQLAFLTQLEQGFIEPACGGDLAGEHFRRVIRDGERFLPQITDSAWRARAHLAVADAYRDIVAVSEGMVWSGPDPSQYRAEAPRARERAVAHYRVFLALEPAAGAVVSPWQAWREAWRLLAGLVPAATRFVCVYD